MALLRRKMWLAVAIVLFSVATVVGVTLFKMSSLSNYYTSFLFSEQAFTRIRSGMTGDQVRDLVGPPLGRRNHQDGTSQWVYSGQVSPDKSYKQLCVYFGKDRLVIAATWGEYHPFKDPNTGEWALGRGRAAQPWLLPKFDLPMIQGDAPAMSGSGDEVTVVEVMASWCGYCSRITPQIEAILEELRGEKPISFILVSVDSSEADMRTYVADKGITTPVAWDPNRSFSARMQRDEIPHFLLIKGNTAYPFDFTHVKGESESYYDDFKWFVRNCAGRR